MDLICSSNADEFGLVICQTIRHVDAYLCLIRKRFYVILYFEDKMSSKRSTGKYELDVQRFRDEGNWKKIIEITEQQNGKAGVDGNPHMFHLFLCANHWVECRTIGDISTW